MPESRKDYSPLINIASGLGTMRDSNSYSVAVRPCYDYQQYNVYYRSSWACRRVVEALPKLMCRKWGKFTFSEKTDKHLSEKLNTRHKDLKVKSKFKLAQFWANLHGRAYVLICTKDNNYSEELKLNKNSLIKELIVLDSRRIYPQNNINNFLTLNPEYYQLRNHQALILPNKNQNLIHKSRLLVFKGNPLPDDERVRELGKEASVLEPFINTWERFFRGSASISEILSNVDIFIHYIDNLLEKLAQKDGAEEETQVRLSTNVLYKSAYRGMVADLNCEKIEYASRNLSGIAPLSERQEAELVAASGLPRSVLFGQFAAGLDASGKITGEQSYLNALVEESQADKFEDNLHYLNGLLWQEKDAPKEPKGWGWRWLELYQESKKEQAEIFNTYSEADERNINNGIYTPKEARSRHEENEFSDTIILEEKSITSNSHLIASADNPQMLQRGGSSYNGGNLRNGLPREPAQRAAPQIGSKNDDNTKVKRIIKWNGFEIGLQYLPFEKRHGKTLIAGYGHLRKTKGADGMAVDVYVGTNLESDRVFIVEQVINGQFDEEKVIIGISSIEEAKNIYLSAMPSEFMGKIYEINPWDLDNYRVDLQPLIIEGEVLGETEMNSIAEFDENDLEKSLQEWRGTTTNQYKNILD